MKKGFFVVLCLVAAQVFAITPTVVNTLKFSTWGFDCYSDMEGDYNVSVLEGECYALVWTSNELTEFPGLPAEPLNPNRPSVNGVWVAEYFPVAEDDGTGVGCMHCPEVSISGLDMWDNTNGTWAVYLLDTRYLDENGEVACGFDASVTNVPRCINAYVAVTENFTIGTSAANPSTGKSMLTTTVKGGCDPADEENYEDMVADQQTSLPEDCPKPVICGVAVANDQVTLTVTNTVPYLAYDFVTTNDVKAISTSENFAGDVKQGIGAGSLSWSLPTGGETKGFFQLRSLRLFGN